MLFALLLIATAYSSIVEARGERSLDGPSASDPAKYAIVELVFAFVSFGMAFALVVKGIRFCEAEKERAIRDAQLKIIRPARSLTP